MPSRAAVAAPATAKPTTIGVDCMRLLVSVAISIELLTTYHCNVFSRLGKCEEQKINSYFDWAAANWQSQCQNEDL